MKVIALILITVFAFSAHGATKKKKRVPPDVALEQKPDQEIQVPQSQVKLDKYEDIQEDKTTQNFELNASTWSPKDLGLEGNVDETGTFKSSGAQISLNYWSFGWDVGSLKIQPKFGLSFAQLARNGTINIVGHESKVSQEMNLYSLRLGGEVTPKLTFLGHFQPYFDLALLPEWEQVMQSEYSDATERTGLALEEVAGLAYMSSSAGSFIGAQSLGLEVGVNVTEGLGANLSGVGIFAGTRVEL